MAPGVQSSKEALRALIGERLRRVSPGDRATASTRARALLTAQPAWQRAQTVLLFAPLPEELDVWPLLPAALAARKRVYLPRFERLAKAYAAYEIRDPATDIAVGHFGIREPDAHCLRLETGGVDFILVPGLGFDRQGHRLGRGKGYYDRLLAEIRGSRCGVGFDEQFVASVPVEPHDASMDCLLAPTDWVEIATGVERRTG